MSLLTKVQCTKATQPMKSPLARPYVKLNTASLPPVIFQDHDGPFPLFLPKPNIFDHKQM